MNFEGSSSIINVRMPPETPTPRRFLLPRRETPQFQSTPQFSSSVTPWSTQRRRVRETEDVDVNVDDDDQDQNDDYYDHDYNKKEEEEAEGNGSAGLRARDLHRDSIEPESDGWTQSQDEGHASSPLETGRRRLGMGLDPDPESRLDKGNDGAADTPHGREAKRRRLATSISAVPESPLQAETVGEDGGSDEDDDDNHAAAAAAIRQNHRQATEVHQPTFQPAPRFKPIASASDAANEDDNGDCGEGLPNALSPHRRGAKPGFLAGGLAAELQRLLSEVRSREDDAGDVRLEVEEVRRGRGMQLVSGRLQGEPEPPGRGQGGVACRKRYVLAGDGRMAGGGEQGRDSEAVVGCVLRIGQPTWEVEVAGTVWTTACAWAVER